MASEGPDVSVVIPTRNRWSRLQTTLEFALRQQEVDFEIVVVDDASGDGTAAGLSAFGDVRLRTLRITEHHGQAQARNLGIEVAAAKWIAFLDDDDLWSPRKLRTMLDALHAHDAAWGYSATVLIDEQRRTLESLSVPDPEQIQRELENDNAIPGGASNVVAASELLRRLGGFDEALEYLTDWDLWIRLSQSARPVVCMETLVGYVLHPGNLHVHEPERVIGELEYMASKYGPVSSARGARFGGVALARWRGACYRQAGQRMRAARAYLNAGIRYRRTWLVSRALGVVLGERMMGMVRQVLHGRRTASPQWLELYGRGSPSKGSKELHGEVSGRHR